MNSKSFFKHEAAAFHLMKQLRGKNDGYLKRSSYISSTSSFMFCSFMLAWGTAI